MKIAISSTGKTLGSALDPRFGRCACFLIIDPADMSYKTYDNPGVAQSGGAGIQAAQFLADKNVTAVITGHVGPNAVQTLSAAGIDIFAQQQGTIKQVVERYKSGGLRAVSQPTVGSHFGTGGVGFARGGGGGRGIRKAAGWSPGQGGGAGQGRGRRS